MTPDSVIIDTTLHNFTQLMLLLGTKTRNAIKDILLRFGLEITVGYLYSWLRPDIRWCQQYAGKENWRWNTNFVFGIESIGDAL